MESRSRALKELAGLFLRLGVTAFGGPAAHIAMMEDEVVRRRKWLTQEEFLDLLGATNLIPGPNSTEMAIHVGHRRAGMAGLVVAGSCFIFPAAAIVCAIAWAYSRFGKLPEVHGVLYGIKPVIIAVVAQALYRLGRSAIKNSCLALIALGAIAASLMRANELLVLLGAGLLSLLVVEFKTRGSGAALIFGPMAVTGAIPSSATALAQSGGTQAMAFSISALFFFFAKVGSVLFGSGYVVLAFLRSDLVEKWGWLSESQLLDAISVGQFTPGPVFTTATFIGYILGGMSGAVAATVGIFLPAFIFVAISGPLVPKLRKSRAAGAVLDGVNAGSLALMAVVTFDLSRSAVVDWTTALLAIFAGFILLRYRVNSAWLVAGGAVAGFIKTLL
jgi:chromate transporter